MQGSVWHIHNPPHTLLHADIFHLYFLIQDLYYDATHIQFNSPIQIVLYFNFQVGSSKEIVNIILDYYVNIHNGRIIGLVKSFWREVCSVGQNFIMYFLFLYTFSSLWL
jgi:hypothetical protein